MDASFLFKAIFQNDIGHNLPSLDKGIYAKNPDNVKTPYSIPEGFVNGFLG